MIGGAALLGIDPTVGYGDVTGPGSLVTFGFELVALALVSSDRIDYIQPDFGGPGSQAGDD